MHEGDGPSNSCARQADSPDDELCLTPEEDEGDGERGEGSEEREGSKPWREAEIPVDQGRGSQSKTEHGYLGARRRERRLRLVWKTERTRQRRPGAHEMHRPHAYDSEGDGCREEEDQVPDTSVRGDLSEEEEGSVGSKDGDEDGGCDDAWLASLGDGSVDVVGREGRLVCKREGQSVRER